jgi:hypothetical protein
MIGGAICIGYFIIGVIIATIKEYLDNRRILVGFFNENDFDGIEF